MLHSLLQHFLRFFLVLVGRQQHQSGALVDDVLQLMGGESRRHGHSNGIAGQNREKRHWRQSAHCQAINCSSRSAARTYVIVAVLYEERYSLATQFLAIGVLAQLVLCAGDIVQQLAVGELAAGQRVDDGSALRVVTRNSLEDRQPRQSRGHAEQWV